MGGVYLDNRDQMIEFGMIGSARAENTRLLGCPRVCSPGKTEIFAFQVAGNAQKL